jgi:hypothetical protein
MSADHEAAGSSSCGLRPSLGIPQSGPYSRLAGPAVARLYLCVPKTSSMSCDQVILVDQATDASAFSDAVVVEIGSLG